MQHPKVLPLAAEPITYTLFHGTFIHTPTADNLEILENTLVGVNSKGEIDYINRNYGGATIEEAISTYKKDTSADHPDIRVIDVSNDPSKFFVPGFVDTHIHASQYPNVGIGLESLLLDWLAEYTFPLEERIKEDNWDVMGDVYRKVIQRTLQNGTTCASYFTTIDERTSCRFAELCLQAGQRSFVGKVCMDHNDTYPQYQESFDECQTSMKSLVKFVTSINPPDEKLVSPIVTPRFAPVCTRELLKWLGEFASELQLPIQTHISENKKEIELVAELFPECPSYASVYSQHKLLTNTTILAHGVHLTEDERELVKQHQCSISHCPTSNSFLTSGEAPVKQYLQEKINVSLGTDVSGGFSSSILSVIRQAILVSHHLAMKSDDPEEEKLTIAECIYMATKGGAKAVNLENTIGTFEIGKRFDAQLIDLESKDSPIDVFAWQMKTDHKSFQNLVGKWIFGGDDRNCVKVWCNGRLVVEKAGAK